MFAGLHSEVGDSFEAPQMDVNLFEVVDLLKGLPDAKVEHMSNRNNLKVNPPPSPSSPFRKSTKNSALPIRTLSSDIKCKPPDKFIVDASV